MYQSLGQVTTVPAAAGGVLSAWREAVVYRELTLPRGILRRSHAELVYDLPQFIAFVSQFVQLAFDPSDLRFNARQTGSQSC